MNLYLLSPEISVGILALVIIFLDFVVQRKSILAWVGVAGLAVPVAFTLALWGQQETSFFGTLVVDQFSVFFKLFFLVFAGLVILASTDYVKRFAHFQGEYYGLVLLAALGMMLLASTGELISIYIALELTTISLCALVCFLKDEKSTEAALKYVLLAVLSSAILLYGMALVYGLTGTTHLDAIGEMVRAHGLLGNPALLLGLALLVAGFGFKVALVPFQMWVPDVYEGAPTPVTAYLAVASKAAGFAVILRVFIVAFGAPAGLPLEWGMLFAVLSAITMTLGNLAAIAQTNIKRMLAYSSIAHVGYVLVGLATVGVAPASDALGKSGVLFFLASYAFANLGAFIAIIAISAHTGSDLIQDFSGMARRSPWIALALTFCLISLTGIPISAGFWAKIYVFNAAVQNGLLWLVLIAVLNTVISAYYYLRVVKVMYMGQPASEEKIPSSTSLRAALALNTAGVLFLGVLPAPLLTLAEEAVRAFTG